LRVITEHACIPYLGSLVSSLTSHFSSNNNVQFNPFYLYPKMMQELEREEFKSLITVSSKLYHIDNLEYEMMNWFDYWRAKVPEVAKTLDTADLLEHCDFFLAIKQAVLTLLTLTATACSIERSFSMLRRVKTWLRSTMTDDRRSALCMMSVHRQLVNRDKKQFIHKVIDNLGSQS